MKPTHYYISASYGNKPKNKLQEEFGEYLKRWNGTLIDQADIVILKEQIETKAEELSNKHRRCKPLQLKWWDTYLGHTTINSEYDFVTFRIRPATLTKLKPCITK